MPRLYATCLALLALAGALAASPRLARLTVPGSPAAVSALPDGAGGLHIAAAGSRGTLYYHWTPRAGFSVPSIIAAASEVTLAGSERAPRLAATPQGLAAVWQYQDQLRFAHSSDSGRTWTRGKPRAGVDMPNLVAAADGRLLVFWADTRETTGDPVAHPLYGAESSDGGVTFTRPARLTPADLPACVCCQSRAVSDAQGGLWLAYRASLRGRKRTVLLRLGGSPLVVSESDWAFNGCPMNGPDLAVDPAGRSLQVTWFQQGSIFARRIDDGGRSPGPVRRLGRGSFHSVLWDPGGRFVVAWDEGNQTGVQMGEGAPFRVNLAPRGAIAAPSPGRLFLVQGR